MSQVQTSPAERRRVLGRMISGLTSKESSWTEEERKRFNTYFREIEELDVQLAATHDGQYYKAFRAWIRHGLESLNPEYVRILQEKRATVGVEAGGAAYPGSTSAFFVPTGFVYDVTEATKYAGPCLTNCTVRDTRTGAVLPFPQDDDTAVAGVAVGEGQQTPKQDIPIKNTVLGAYKYSSQAVLMSLEQLQDSGIPVDSYLARKFGIRLGRVLEPLFVNGSGSGQPTGFVTNLVNAGSTTVTAAGSSDTDGTGGANTLGLQDLVTVEKVLDPTYRLNARWMLHPNSVAYLRTVKNKQGEPVFWALENDTPTLLGYRILLNPNLDQLQSNASSPAITRNTVAFGDWSKYVIRRAAPMMLRLTERYIDYGQVAFVMIWRIDGNLIDGSAANRAVVLLQNVY